MPSWMLRARARSRRCLISGNDNWCVAVETYTSAWRSTIVNAPSIEWEGSPCHRKLAMTQQLATNGPGRKCQGGPRDARALLQLLATTQTAIAPMESFSPRTRYEMIQISTCVTRSQREAHRSRQDVIDAFRRYPAAFLGEHRSAVSPPGRCRSPDLTPYLWEVPRIGDAQWDRLR